MQLLLDKRLIKPLLENIPTKSINFKEDFRLDNFPTIMPSEEQLNKNLVNKTNQQSKDTE